MRSNGFILLPPIFRVGAPQLGAPNLGAPLRLPLCLADAFALLLNKEQRRLHA